MNWMKGNADERRRLTERVALLEQRYAKISRAKRPTLMRLAADIMKHTINRGGESPKRWVVSKKVMHQLTVEIQNYAEASGDMPRSAPIDRMNFLVLGVPVVGR